MKEPGARQTELLPEFLAASLVPMAAGHMKSLVETLVREASQKEKHVLGEEETLRVALDEASLAYFCLASLRVYSYFGDSQRWNKYGAAMLTSLKEYPEADLGYVQEAFCDDERVDDAVNCYVNDRLNEQVQQDLNAVWNFLALSEDNPMGIFAAKLHVRLMRILGVQRNTLPYFVAWLSNSAGVLAAWKTFSNFRPVLKT